MLRPVIVSLAAAAVALTALFATPRASEAPSDPLPPLARPGEVFYEPNAGQFDPAVRFVARSASGTTFITPTGAVLARRGAWFELQVAGAAAAEPVGEGLLGTRLNYFLGSQPSRWRFGVPAVARVRQSELRPGVALLFHSEGARPELDLELQPGVDAEGVQLALAHFEGIEVEPSGALAVTAGAERFVLRKPRVYQQVDGTRREIAAAYRLLGPGRVGFEVGAHDPRLALVIDPVLETSTCFGGGNYENGAQLALDASGAPVFIGSSDSSDYPVVAPLQATPAGSSDLVLTKLNATASGVVFSTWLGGDNIEISGDIALDASGAIYVAGTSFSDDYPRVGAFQSTNAFGDSTGVVTKLAANGASIIYSTYLGGTLDEAMRGIAVDSSGNAVVCGETRSTNFPLASAAQAAPSGMLDGFVARLSPSGASLVFSTYLGGLDSDSAADCAVDPSGNVYVTGYATSGFPTTAGAFQTAMSGGSSNDGFVVKLSTTGGRTWASLLGGDGDDQAAGLAVDAAGRVTVTGRTNSVDFPTTAGSYQPQKLLPITTGNSDVFVSRFTPAGDALIFSTFLGGSVGDEGYAIALDAAGSAYITGYTDSLASAIRFPQVAAAFVPAQSGGAVFVTRLRPDGAALLHSMLIGGSDQNDYSHAIAVSPSGRTWVGGDTLSADYPTRSPVQPTCVNRELFITQLRPALAFTSLTPTYGTAGGGTTVSLWGELPPGSVVRFGGTAATGYTVVDLAHATAVTPARPQGFIDVTVTGPDGGVNTVVNGFRYVSPPSISAVTPPFGAAGTALAITGSNFYPEASVTLGGVAGASVTVVDAGLIRVVAPANSMGPHDLVVTNLPGFSATATAGFTYVPAPGLTSLSQPFGPAAGGTAVTATGSGFRAGVTVTVGGAPATGVMLLSATQLSFVTPARALGAASVVVTNLDGQSGTLSGGFTYVPPATVLQVVPPQGPTTGGTNLTVKGIGFQPGAALLFDATPLSAAYVDSTTLTSTAPASPARRVTVTVRNSDGQSGSLDAGFTYVSGPGITGVSPSTGPVAGGKTVTLTGFAFQSGLTVSFGGVAATTTRFTSATEVTAVAPAHGAGTVDIGVVNLDGQPGGLPAAFTYVTPPTLISIAPQSGPAGGGTRVTLRGAGFSEVASVTFGGAPATDVVKVDATTVQATAPAHAAGTVDVTLTDAEGQASTLAAGYQLVAAPALTSITPNNGSTLGGTTVTLTGTDFSSQAQVSFGSTAAVGVTVTSATSLTAVTPQHEEGQTDVTVSNPDGQRDTLSLGFTFAVPGCATSSDCAGGRCVAGVCQAVTPRSHFAFGCGAAPGPLALAGVLAWMLLRRRRAALLALPALGAESAKPRLTFMGLSAGGGVTDEAARSLAEYTQSELAGTRVYDVTSTSDLEKILGVERQKQLLGCSESSESCMAEIAGALNSDRLLSGSVQRADDTLIVNLSLIDPKSARVIGRAFRRVESPGGLKPVIEAIPGLVYELVNQEPRLEGRTVRPPRTFSGLMLGVLGAVDFLGFGAGGTSSLPISPGIVLEYAGRYFGGALTVLPKVDFGARLEARYYPLVLKNVLRPHLAAGSTLMLSGASVRGALGATLRVEAFVAFLDVGYERFFNFQAPPGPAGQFVYSQNAVVGGLGVGWLF